MKQSSLTRALLVAGAIGLAGAAAQADAIFYPDGTSVELGESGADTLALGGSDGILLSESDMIDTSVLGGPAATLSTTTVSPTYVYVQPNINFDRATAKAQLQHHRSAMRHHNLGDKSAAATFNVPTRAGEASTMTGGAPNMVTDNNVFVVGSHSVPYASITVGEPYYVMSY